MVQGGATIERRIFRKRGRKAKHQNEIRGGRREENVTVLHICTSLTVRETFSVAKHAENKGNPWQALCKSKLRLTVSIDRQAVFSYLLQAHGDVVKTILLQKFERARMIRISFLFCDDKYGGI